MPRQLSFLASEPLNVKPEFGRVEPRLWVRKLVIWKDPDTIIREITLRPGLNIIWSPDPFDQRGAARRPDGLGHGSGKTLFCRLLRYCLGEDRFADDNQRHRIADALEKGMVGAEVIVEGTPWAVLRPVGLGRRHIAMQDVDLQTLIGGDFPATGITPFLHAVENIILTKPVTDLINGDHGAMAWLLSLAWLCRDQECRFNDVLDWRSPASDSESPARALSQNERLAAVRALIGAIVPGEYRVREEIAVLTKGRETAEPEAHHRRWEASRLRTRLIRETGIAASDVPEGLLGVEPLRTAAQRMLARIAGVGPSVDVVNIEALRSDLEAVRNRQVVLAGSLREIETRIPILEKLIQSTESQLPGLGAQVFSASGEPLCPVCEVPIEKALADGCDLSSQRADLPLLRLRYHQLEDQLASDRIALAADRENRIRVEQDLGDVVRDVAQRRQILDAAENARDTHSAAWFKARHLIDEASRLRDLLAEGGQEQANMDALDVQIEEKRERLSAFRDEQAQVFQTLSNFFDGIVGELVHGATGSVKLDGNGLKLSVDFGGDRSTAAIDSLKVVAFDLAVMCMSIEGSIRLPAFLVHDSPREADLGLSVYHHLFAAVQSLEPDEETPLFQYIVTTTTPPPQQFKKKPWLVETLRGTPAEARLLKQDL